MIPDAARPLIVQGGGPPEVVARHVHRLPGNKRAGRQLFHHRDERLYALGRVDHLDRQRQPGQRVGESGRASRPDEPKPSIPRHTVAPAIPSSRARSRELLVEAAMAHPVVLAQEHHEARGQNIHRHYHLLSLTRSFSRYSAARLGTQPQSRAADAANAPGRFTCGDGARRECRRTLMASTYGQPSSRLTEKSQRQHTTTTPPRSHGSEAVTGHPHSGIVGAGHRPDRVPFAVLLTVGCGGVVGAISRYLIQLALPSDPGRFPTGTFIINLSGSALLGFLLVVLNERFADRRLARPLLGTGLIGAYTTFSTFTVEAVLLARAGQVPTPVAYVGLSVVLGLGAGVLGMSIGRLSARRLSQAAEPEG